MSRPTQGRLRLLPVRGCHPLWPAFPNGSGSTLNATGLVRVRSPLLAESQLMSFPPATEMFQFAGFASGRYVFTAGRSRRIGLPHSEIHGSKPARGSPWLITACYVLHRLSMPRHPPNALNTLELSSAHAAPFGGKQHGLFRLSSTLRLLLRFRVRKIREIVTPANLPFEDHQHWVSAGLLRRPKTSSP